MSPSASSGMGVLKIIFIFTQLLPLTWTINTDFLPCLADKNSTEVDCTRRSYNLIPFLNSRHFKPAPTVACLDLSQTKLRRLGEHTFSIFPNLHTLRMMDNCISHSGKASCKIEIHNSTFKSLRKLEVLDLSGNSLSSIPELPDSLRVLNLQYNRISSIIYPLGTPNLRQLLLSSNCFHDNPCNQSFYISKAVFQALPKLRNLTLGFNNLTAIPDGLPPSLESLNLKENTIPVIANYSFSHLPRLKELILEWNCQRCDHAARTCIPCPNNASLGLSSNSFYAENSSIVFLSLRGNSLKTFPEGLFTPLRHLKYLDLSDNFLANATRDGTFFSELRSVTWISLLYNYEPLKTFSELFLSPHIANISSLQSLLLSGNFFHNVSKESLDVLSKLKHLKKLELRMNFISECDLTAFRRLPSLTFVDLSQNTLNFIPRSQRPTSEIAPQHCDYENWNSSKFQTPSCAVTEHNVMSGGDTLESTLTDFLENSVTHFPSMYEIRSHFCKNQLTFDLSQNYIMSLDRAVFDGIEHAVCLDLSFNYMSPAFKKKPFSRLKKLASLNLAYNRLDFYYTESFSELKDTLSILDVSKNEFHFKMKGMGHRFGFLKNLIKLKVLNFANNGIAMRIDQRLESHSLKYLYFSGNRLDIMWKTGIQYNQFFQGLTSLIFLDISKNMLKTIAPVVLCSLPSSIQSLNISKNVLFSFPWLNISALSSLSHLDLSSNHLNSLPTQAVEFGANFSFLDLSNNHLTIIPEKVFDQAKSLQYLYLSHNRIKELTHRFLPASFQNDSMLKSLTLHENPFKCDCDTTWFTDFLLSTPLQIPYLTTLVKCQYPESKQNMSILTIDQHSCQDIYGGLAFLLSTFLVSMVTVLPLLKHLYGWDLWYCLQLLWAGHKGYSQLAGGDSPYQFDAFVVFDTGNQAVRDWVYNELTVHLENSGQRRFCLCLEERDWIPGLSCIENLHNAVYNSLKTVFVLSSDGEMVNGVIRQAFFMVQQRLLDDKMDVAILVLLDEMFPKLKYLQLRKRLCRKSVLSWPRNPRAQPLFWNTLRMALSSDNLKSYDKNMSESFI